MGVKVTKAAINLREELAKIDQDDSATVREDSNGNVVIDNDLTVGGLIYQNGTGTNTFAGNITVPALNDTTLTADFQQDLEIFSTGAGAAQSGAFYNKVRIFGGSSQTRSLDLYQVDSGDTYMQATYAINIGTLGLNSPINLAPNGTGEVNVVASHMNLDDASGVLFGGGTSRPGIIGDKPSNTLDFYSFGAARMTMTNVLFTTTIPVTVGDDFIVNTTLNTATGDESAVSINYTTNKATSGADTGLEINKTDTASPGTSLLVDAQVGGVSQATIDDAGSYAIQSKFEMAYNASTNALDFNYIGV